MDKESLIAEMNEVGNRYGSEYTRTAKELVGLFDTIESLKNSVKNANKNLVKATVACYEAMLTKGYMGEEKKKYTSVRQSFIRFSGKLHEAENLAKIIEKRLETIKSQE